MFTEIVKLKPVMDSAQLNRMFTDLSRRFGQVAKTFGNGMKNAFKFGGVIGLVGAVVGKLINPLERAEELFNKMTNKGDDAVTNAQELGTTPGKLLRLQGLVGTFGMDAETLRTMLGKFQGKLAAEQDAAAAPARIAGQLAMETDPIQKQILQAQLEAAKIAAAQGGTLHEFIGEKDMAEAFLSFVQSMQALDPARRTVVQSEVFGEKIRGKGSEFFNAKPTEIKSALDGLPASEALTVAAEKLGGVADLVDKLRERRELFDLITKSGLINEGQARQLNESMVLADTKDNEKLQQFDSLKSASIATQEIGAKIDKFITDITVNVLPEVVKGMTAIAKFLPTVGEAKDGVTKVTDPILEFAANQQYNAQGVMDDPMGALRNDINRMRETINSVWADFKSSPVYRLFGKDKQ